MAIGAMLTIINTAGNIFNKVMEAKLHSDTENAKIDKINKLVRVNNLRNKILGIRYDDHNK